MAATYLLYILWLRSETDSTSDEDIVAMLKTKNPVLVEVSPRSLYPSGISSNFDKTKLAENKLEIWNEIIEILVKQTDSFGNDYIVDVVKTVTSVDSNEINKVMTIDISGDFFRGAGG